jgi:hypothetical protein
VSSAKTYNVQLVLQQAQTGRLSVAEMKRHIKQMQDRGSPVARSAAIELRAIVQREEGKKAVAALDEGSQGSAKWAFAQLGAALVTPYRWSATTAEGQVVIGLWDEPTRFGPGYLPLHQKEPLQRQELIERMPGVTQNRKAFYQDLEVAVAAHAGLVTAILATAVDIDAIPRQRKPGFSRPWLNEDGTPVVLRIKDLDIGKRSYSMEFAELDKRPRCPFERTRLGAVASTPEDSGD